MVNVGIRCNKDLKNEILVYIKSIYELAPDRSEEIKEGRGILNHAISPSSYPKKLPAITRVEGREIYTYYNNPNAFSK